MKKVFSFQFSVFSSDEACLVRCYLFCFLLLLVFAGCIPAQVPPHLEATAGAVVIITEQVYQNDLFSLRYPEGWRVITSPTNTPVFVILAAPENQALVMVSVSPIEQAPALPDIPPERQQTELRELDPQPLYVAVVVDTAVEVSMRPVIEDMLRTVTAK